MVPLFPFTSFSNKGCVPFDLIIHLQTKIKRRRMANRSISGQLPKDWWCIYKISYIVQDLTEVLFVNYILHLLQGINIIVTFCNIVTWPCTSPQTVKCLPFGMFISTRDGNARSISLVCKTIWKAYLQHAIQKTKIYSKVSIMEPYHISIVCRTYRLCKHFWFLKSSIIFFTKSKVTTSPSILAPEYCDSTSTVKKKNN